MNFIIVANNKNKGLEVCSQSGKPGEEFWCSDWPFLWGFLSQPHINNGVLTIEEAKRGFYCIDSHYDPEFCCLEIDEERAVKLADIIDEGFRKGNLVKWYHYVEWTDDKKLNLGSMKQLEDFFRRSGGFKILG